MIAESTWELGAAGESRSSADQIIAALVSKEVNTFFGVPGGPVMPMFDAVLRHKGARLVESRHETSAVFSAVGCWSQSGEVPAVLVTAGPGGTNSVTGVAAAYLERVPLVLICGDVAWATTGARHLQDMGPEGLDIEALLSPVTRERLRVQSSAAATGPACRAVAQATCPGSQGPPRAAP